MNLENTQTLKNLARAYAVETQDGARYQFLRKMAIKQQQQFIANTLKMLAANEMAHAKVWFDLITEQGKKAVPNVDLKFGYPFNTGSFEEQFRILAEVEKEEGEKLYIGFAKTARKEGLENVAKFFDMTAQVEREHSLVLSKIYEGLKSGTLFKSDQQMTWKCVGCGYETKGKNAWRICPLCGVPQGYAMSPALILVESDIKSQAQTKATSSPKTGASKITSKNLPVAKNKPGRKPAAKTSRPAASSRTMPNKSAQRPSARGGSNARA